jgi:hypothetical protein
MSCILLARAATEFSPDSGAFDAFVVAAKKHPYIVAVLLIAFFSFWSVFGLSTFHMYLVSTAQVRIEEE